MLNKAYQCVNCQKIYTSEIPNDLFCTETECNLIGLLIEFDIPYNNANETNKTQVYVAEKSLLILLIDSSDSMFSKHAFPNTSFKSKYDNEFLSRAEMSSHLGASAIFDLERMTSPNDFHVCLILFDYRRSVIFFKSVTDIMIEYKSLENLSKFIFDKMSEMKGKANIGAALDAAYRLSNKFIEGSIERLGEYVGTQHLVPTLSGFPKDIYNVRTLVYTDGEQHEDFGALTNSLFQDMENDLLIGIFIGEEEENGYNTLKNILGNCPMHGEKQLFSITSPVKVGNLKRMFFQASGVSAFCPQCQATKPIPDHWK